MSTREVKNVRTLASFDGEGRVRRREPWKPSTIVVTNNVEYVIENLTLGSLSVESCVFATLNAITKAA